MPGGKDGPASVTQTVMSAPTLIYFPFAGRGELSRLVAAAGGVELSESAENDGSFFGALPILKHDDLELCQSQAITSYIASIGPKFASLTAAQKGVDAMYAGILEDVLSGCASGAGSRANASWRTPFLLTSCVCIPSGIWRPFDSHRGCACAPQQVFCSG